MLTLSQSNNYVINLYKQAKFGHKSSMRRAQPTIMSMKTNIWFEWDCRITYRKEHSTPPLCTNFHFRTAEKNHLFTFWDRDCSEKVSVFPIKIDCFLK